MSRLIRLRQFVVAVCTGSSNPVATELWQGARASHNVGGVLRLLSGDGGSRSTRGWAAVAVAL